MVKEPSNTNKHQSSIAEHLDSVYQYCSPPLQQQDNLSDVVGENASNTFILNTIKETKKTTNDSFIFSLEEYSLILITVFFYVFVLTIFKQSYVKLLRSFTRKNIDDKIEEILDVNMQKFINLGEWLFITSVSLLITIFNDKILALNISKITLFLLSITSFLFFKMIRKIINYSIYYVTENAFFSIKLNVLYKSIYSIAALTVVPVLIIFMYSPLYQYISALYLTISISILYFWMLLLIIFSTQKVYFLEYILYLCAVEIIPLLSIYIFLYRMFIV